MAGALKDEGNASFKVGAYEAAVDSYTRALELDPEMHLCFSNRSAAYLKLACSSGVPEARKVELLEKALYDADKCVEINASWAKGYSRQAAVLQELKRWTEAEAACKKGLELGPDSALETRRQEVLARHFQSKLLGTWHGTVAETLGGYDQEMEFLDESSVRVAVLGRSIVGRYWVGVGGDNQPIHLNIQVPMQEAPPGMPPPPAVPYIARTDTEGLHICCPFMTMDRPTEFSGPGYCLMKPGPLSGVDESAEVKNFSYEQKLLECTKELMKALPSSKIEEVSHTDNEEATREKLMAQVRFESSMYAVQKKFGEDIMKEVLEATKPGAAPAALAGTKELKELEHKMKTCGLMDTLEAAAPPSTTSSSRPAQEAREAKKAANEGAQEKSAATPEATTKKEVSDSGNVGNSQTLQVAGLLALGAAVAAIAFVAWRRQRR